MKRKLIVLTILTCLFSSGMFAQIDKHFSMFSDTKVQINPATSGFFKAKYRLSANYRQQWTAATKPYTTYSASFNARVYENDWNTKFVSGGIYFYNDLSGDSKYLQTKIVLPVNYSIKLDDFNSLSFGLSPGFFQRTIRNTDLTWSSQWTGLAYDKTLTSGETIGSDKYAVSRFDVGAGIYWEIDLTDDSRMGVGISGDHLTKPKLGFYQEKERMYRSLNIQYFGVFGQEDTDLTIKPSAMFAIQGPNKYLVFGSTFDILLKGDSKHTSYYSRTSVEFGGHLRLNDAVIFSAFIHKGGLSAGFAYDVAISSINNLTGIRGASEFFLSYRIGKSKGKGTLELEDEE